MRNMRKGWTKNRWSRLLAAALALLVLGVYLHVEAGQERYDYDGLGRLIRRIDSQSRATEYVYDAAGNIVRVTAGTGAVQAPSIAQITPTSMRRGETKQVTITGTNLTGVGVSTDTAALDIYDVHANQTQVSFTLTASPNASTGAHAIRVTSAAGSASTSINVAPVLPKLTVEPTPLAIPPDGVARQITLRISNADTMAHTIALSAPSAKIALSPAQLTFQAGQTTATAVVTGISAGTANILITSATLGSSGVPVYVTADFRGISTSYAQSLGVVLEAPSSADRTISPVASKLLGVTVGNYISAMSPTAFVVGGSSQLTVSGTGLDTATAVSALPNTGMTLGAITASPDGKSLSIPVTVTGNASLGPRQIIVSDAAGKPFPVARPNADRIDVVRAGPEIYSIDPLFITRGTTLGLTVRGRSLQEAQFSIVPNADMAIGNDPAINTDGTEARIQISAGLTASLGDYSIVATTLGGSSNAALSASNTLRVVNEIGNAVTPIVSLPVGIVLQDSAAASQSSSAYSRLLGVSVGSVVTGLSPAAGIIGTTVTLTLQGVDLQGISAIQFNPATGITAGPIRHAADGKSVSVDLSIAADAPRTGRALTVTAGTTVIPFSDPAAMQFLVTAPLPAIASVAPNAILRGQTPQTLVISGSNFKDASAVVALPPDNVTVSPPTVNADANQIAVTIAAATDAAVGPRTVIVVTPAGQSSAIAAAANTLTIAQTITPGPSPLVSPTLGVVLEDGTLPAPATGFLVSPSLGLMLETVPAPAPVQGPIMTKLGIALGPVTTTIEPTGFAPATTGFLTVRGSSLQQVDTVTVEPAAGITVGNATASADGSFVAVPITVAAEAQPLLPRRVQLSAAGTAIPDVRPNAMTFQVGPGVPHFDSISPILAKGGDKLTLTVRGQNLAGAIAVTATPPEGVVVSNTLNVDAAGMLTVDLYVSPEAPLGPRVIRVWVPGAASDEAAAPANTFTVYAP